MGSKTAIARTRNTPTTLLTFTAFRCRHTTGYRRFVFLRTPTISLGSVLSMVSGTRHAFTTVSYTAVSDSGSVWLQGTNCKRLACCGGALGSQGFVSEATTTGRYRPATIVTL